MLIFNVWKTVCTITFIFYYKRYINVLLIYYSVPMQKSLHENLRNILLYVVVICISRL
jgi:hypothetical protein